MATGHRHMSADLTAPALRALSEAPETVHLLQALRMLDAVAQPGARMGETRRPVEDAIRLGQEAELAFPPSTIAAIEPATAKRPPKLVNRFFGLFGPHGPLPLHLTEYARNRARHEGDGTMIAFADMLIHRLMTLFFRAWSSALPAPSHDRPEDTFSRHVRAAAGLRGEHLTDRDAMPDLAKLHFAGIMGNSAKSAEGLERMVSAFFRAPVRVQEFVGSWLELEPGDAWHLGTAPLGHSTGLGTRVWSRAAKFRIVIGPLSLPEYKRLLPGGDALTRLKAIVQNHTGQTLDWDVNLVLQRADVPAPVLGQSIALGHTFWIGEPPKGRPVADLHLHPPQK